MGVAVTIYYQSPSSLHRDKRIRTLKSEDGRRRREADRPWLFMACAARCRPWNPIIATPTDSPARAKAMQCTRTYSISNCVWLKLSTKKKVWLPSPKMQVRRFWTTKFWLNKSDNVYIMNRSRKTVSKSQ